MAYARPIKKKDKFAVSKHKLERITEIISVIDSIHDKSKFKTSLININILIKLSTIIFKYLK